MIIENPYSAQHYLTRYWPLQPKLIDNNRHERGDFYKKPTQYFFVNCEPKNNVYLFPENYKEVMKVIDQKTVGRSMISHEYARRFILEHIIDRQEGMVVI